jgi:N-acetylmuramoyl-L-alanine amidase
MPSSGKPVESGFSVAVQLVESGFSRIAVQLVESGFSRIAVQLVESGFSRIAMHRIALLLLAACAVTLHGQSSDPAALYQQALRREAVLRQELDAARAGAPGGAVLERIRVLIGSYEDMARLFPRSDSSDDSLSRAGVLASDAFTRFGETADRDTAIRILKSLQARFPASPLTKEATGRVRALEAGKPAATIAKTASPPAAPPAAPVAAPAPKPAAAATPPESASRSAAASVGSPVVMLRAIRREVLPETLRVTLELDREVAYYDERIDGPPRVFVDLPNTRAVEELKDATIPFPEGPVRQVRVGRQLNQRTRVVLDLSGAGSHSVYAVYNPYRIVIDIERPTAGGPPAIPTQNTSLEAPPARAPLVMTSNVSKTTRQPAPAVPAEAPTADKKPAPSAPPHNSNGSFSLARQLGLGVTRIVIDPGHGGHDPGARGNGISEAALVLDVAIRLEALLRKENVEVILTRRTDAFVALEDRTALANRSDADLFLSIHANASTVPAARGIETYFLNFAPNPEAEAIAARENAGSSKSMRHLPDIVQAIALNNKIDESRDLATIVQATLYQELRKTNRTLKNLGVKQAPFMVLVGATMPSVLAEISFMSNSAEATLLKTDRYKQQIAEALLAGIMRYQNSLKKGSSRAE